MLCKEESPSRVSAITDRRDIGLYDVPMLMSLLGLGIGMMLANFQTCGILLSFIAALYMFVRYCSTFLPMFLRCLMLSGPVELFLLSIITTINTRTKYKLYERLILNRIIPTVESHLNKK